MPDYSTGLETKPLELLTRLAVTVPDDLEATVEEIRCSYHKGVSRLVGEYPSVSELLRGLSHATPDPSRLRLRGEEPYYGAR
jgi:hypothetical protein